MANLPGFTRLNLGTPMDVLTDHPWKVPATNVILEIQPLSATACGAFDAVARQTISEPRAERTRNHMNVVPGRWRQGANQTGTDDRRKGCYQLSADLSPHCPNGGWTMGTGQVAGDVDFQLAPSEPKWNAQGIHPFHTAISIARDSFQLILVAIRTAIITSGRNTNALIPGRPHVLHDGDSLTLKACTYTFHFTSFYKGIHWERYAQKALNTLFMNPHTTPSAMTRTRNVGEYVVSEYSLGKGAFGTVFAAWDPQGKAVAIKRQKFYSQADLDAHKDLIGLIGKHVSDCLASRQINSLLTCHSQA